MSDDRIGLLEYELEKALDEIERLRGILAIMKSVLTDDLSVDEIIRSIEQLPSSKSADAAGGEE